MSEYAAQKTVTDQTLISLSQLDAKYQKVALSALNLSEAERQEINTKLQGLAAGKLMTGQQMQELLMDTNLDVSTKKQILSETGLTNAIGLSTIAETEYVKKQLEELVQREIITEDIKEAILAKMADVGATNTMTGANHGLALSFKELMASIPVWGWIALAISAVISVLQTVIPMIKSTSEQLEETHQAFKETQDEIISLNDELQTTQDRINELKSKGTLSFTEAAELKRLKAENAEREHTIWLLKEENKERTKTAQNKFDRLVKINPDFDTSKLFDILDTESDRPTNWLARFIYDFTDDYNLQYALTNFTSLSEARNILNNLLDSGYEYGTNDSIDKKIDYVYKIIDAFDAYSGATDTLFASVFSRPKYTEAAEAIEQLGTVTAESLTQLYKNNDKVKEFVDYLLSLGTIDWKTVLGEDFDRVAGDDGIVSTAEALGWMNEKGENSAKVMGLFANELNKVEVAANSASNSLQTFSSIFDSVQEGADVLMDAYNDLSDGGEISLEHLMALLDAYPDLVNYVDSENGSHRITIDTLKEKFEAQKQVALGKIQATRKAIELEGAEQSAIERTLEAMKDKQKQDMASVMVSNGMFKTIGAAIDAINARPGYYLRGLNTSYGYEQAAEKAKNEQLEILKKQEALIKGMEWDDFSGGSKKSPIEKNKEAAEKYFAELKYKLETNKITQEEYLKTLDKKYKEYYNKTADYLEDYAKYSQEVYDGFKDMYKEDLEAQKEAWEEKKDAVSEYYDNLREQIENSHDEEDYEKEQSEKRKEIFDLDMQIAELMRDGSEKAKARIAELEEERLKAEEELLDFETDKAREDELSRLEKEQEAEEKKIQDQIDTIDKELETIDEDIVSVRNAIINYAAKKGVTLDFAYASGTRSSVGGFGRINEKGIEMISAPDGNGNYVNLMPNSYVFSAKATEFLWKLATEHSLPQAMYNSIAKSIKTQSNTPSVNIAQPITITMGDVIIKGNADKQTVADIKKQQENTVRMVLQKIKELQK